MHARIRRIHLSDLIALCALSAGITTAATAAGTAPTPATSGPVFGQPATGGLATPGAGPGTAAQPVYGSPQWDMDGKSERRDKRRRDRSDEGTQLWTNPGGANEAQQKNTPAFP